MLPHLERYPDESRRAASEPRIERLDTMRANSRRHLGEPEDREVPASTRFRGGSRALAKKETFAACRSDLRKTSPAFGIEHSLLPRARAFLWSSSFAQSGFMHSGLADEFRRHPSDDNQGNQNFPAIRVSVSCHGKVIANHDKDNRNRNKSIVFGT